MSSSCMFGFCSSKKVVTLLLLLLPAATWFAAASSSTLSSPTPSLPRSRSSRRWGSSGNNNVFDIYPPWNTSPRIHYDGFLKDEFRRIPGEWEPEVRLRTRQRLETKCRIRQVPGDGNCLFHSISLCLQHATNGTHWDLTKRLEDLYEHSQTLRQQAVACLRQPRKRLFLQGREILQSGELVQAAAQQYGLSSQEYCAAMEQDCVWGGGPEIVALCNILQRPIHVYELAACTGNVVGNNKNCHHHDNGGRKTFVLRRMACFGSPRFDRREALHILSADSRFPDVLPGEQLEAGNHFLAVFPMRPARRLRGGSIREKFKNNNNEDDDDDDDDDAHWVDWEAETKPWSFLQWWKDLFLQ